jgi:hypothetical protein
MDLDARVSAAHRQDDLTKHAYFGPITSPLGRVMAVLMTYCTPRLQYDGIGADAIAQMILNVLEEPKPQTPPGEEPKPQTPPDALRDIKDHTA